MFVIERRLISLLQCDGWWPCTSCDLWFQQWSTHDSRLVFSVSQSQPAAQTQSCSDAATDCNILRFSWSSAVSSISWTIHTMQISCSASWRPPAGCLQYFTGTSGTISSYNYEGGLHLANQLYSICVRSERGYCSIGYTAIDTDTFQVSGQNPGGTSVQGDGCTTDYLEIVGGGDAVGANTNYDRFCGNFFNLDPTSSAIVTIYTNLVPYRLVGEKIR